jgi:glycosyltransferase involved in cell wall biosynthesis
LKVAIVTPTRNEEKNLGGLLQNVLKQTRLPDTWVFVDDSSTDGTFMLSEKIALENRWILAFRADYPGRGLLDRTFMAFQFGVDRLGPRCDLVLKLDADTRLPQNYIETMIKHFEDNPKLGIASGRNADEWTLRHHLRGNNRIYNMSCWKALDLSNGGVGWDTVDIIIAKSLGWETETFQDLVCRHLRRRNRSSSYAMGLGKLSRYLGYYPWYAAARFSALLVKDGPFQALSFALGFIIDGYGNTVERYRILVRRDERKRVSMWLGL